MENSSELHPVAKQLMALMLKKQSNICVAADFHNAQQVLDVGSYSISVVIWK